jgi:hypothetical protein
MAKLPAMAFALEMRANHTYVPRIAMSGDSELVLEALEQDDNGTVYTAFRAGHLVPRTSKRGVTVTIA